MIINVDESSLNETDRLGLAWCRLNNAEWDDILGPKPEGFDEMSKFPEPWWKFWKRKKPTKSDILWNRMQNIKSMIGEANVSRCWWIFALGRTEEEWRNWYINER